MFKPKKNKVDLASQIEHNEQAGQVMAIKLFHAAAERVPAYRDFLKKENIKPAKIKTLADFKQVTPVDKKNYLTKYSLEQLSWDGDLFDSRIISVSSGSSGTPLFWPRGRAQDEEAVEMYEDYYTKIFDVDKQSTLFIICFSMGTWIAGSYTTAGTLGVAAKDYDINVVTPGLEKAEAIKSVKALGHLYDQIVLVGYPPFIKDLLDDGADEGINWKKYKIRFSFAGEAYTEEWRDHVHKLVGSGEDLRRSINVYGTADAGILGQETPVTVALRRTYNRHAELMESIFGTPVLPGILQYDPRRRYFEELDHELVFSANSGIPLIRYNIHDGGGLLDYNSIIGPVESEYKKLLGKQKLRESDWAQSFLYLRGRKDFTVTIYAVNIYPENIKAALEDKRMADWVTGKFTMQTKNFSDMDQYFEINIELRNQTKPNAEKVAKAREVLHDKLTSLNAEYKKLYAAIGDKARPHIQLIENGNANYFPQGLNKHKWVQKHHGTN